MKVLNFGSLNVDYVYDVDHFVMPGETITAYGRNIFAGGKGLNQSVALAKAGVEVYHAGSIGADGDILTETLDMAGVDTSFIYKQDAPGGHTVIQVDKNGQNCIIFYGGTNMMISRGHIDKVLASFDEGDILVLQNEINELGYIIDKAYGKGMKIALNPSPCNEAVTELPLEKISWFIINEIEGATIAGTESIDDMIPEIARKYPDAKILLTLGDMGAKYYDGHNTYEQGIFPVKAVDTTAAGDTTLGYFISGVASGLEAGEILRRAAKASSMAVSKKGASGSIPTLEEVEAELR